MGYVKNKYTESYYLNKDSEGKRTPYGVNGVEEFLQGGIREQDLLLLSKINFTGAVVIDFGFGRGEAIKYALEHGAKRVIGIDFSRDAYVIACNLLKRYGLSAELFCDEAVTLIDNIRSIEKDFSVDIVLMLDFVEHIPRSELSSLLPDVTSVLSNRGVVVVNTPIFKVDNDVVGEGLKELAKEASDEIVETLGMHCNRYTRKSLLKYMRAQSLSAISNHFFISSSVAINLIPFRMFKHWWASRDINFLQRQGWVVAIPDEYALNSDDIRWKKKIQMVKHIILIIAQRLGFHRSRR